LCLYLCGIFWWAGESTLMLRICVGTGTFLEEYLSVILLILRRSTIWNLWHMLFLMLLWKCNGSMSWRSHHRSAYWALSIYHLSVVHRAWRKSADVLSLSLLTIHLRSHSLSLCLTLLLRRMDFTSSVSLTSTIFCWSQSSTTWISRWHRHSHSVISRRATRSEICSHSSRFSIS
jgi:hypothetical protein